MKTLILWHGTYPWDIRIEKFARALTARPGDSVVLVVKGAPGSPPRESAGGVTIARIGSPRTGSAWSKLKAAPLIVNPVWIAGLGRLLREEKPDLLIVRDLPLTLLAGMLGRAYRVPVVMDMAENYPAALLAYRRKIYAPFLAFNALLPRLYERFSLRFVEAVIVVAEEQRQRLIRAGIARERIVIVGNTPDRERMGRLAAAGTSASRPVAGRYIFYSGFLDHHRGIQTLIEAFARIYRRHPGLSLVLVGSGRSLETLKGLARELNISKRVHFTGWLDFEALPALIKNSTVCVIPHLKTEHTDTTLPNKIFDYLFFAKPVVVSNAVPLVRIAREWPCGAVFKSGDPIDLARALNRVLSRVYPERLLKKGPELVASKYNWENDARVLRELSERTVAGGYHVAHSHVPRDQRQGQVQRERPGV